jgi:hypothetical protein
MEDVVSEWDGIDFGTIDRRVLRARCTSCYLPAAHLVLPGFPFRSSTYENVRDNARWEPAESWQGGHVCEHRPHLPDPADRDLRPLIERALRRQESNSLAVVEVRVPSS